MPEVGMKQRGYFVQQINMLGQFVNQQKEFENPETKVTEVRDVMDVGLACGLITNELLVDIRDLLLQMALKPDHCHACEPMAQGGPRAALQQTAGKGILLAKDFPGGL